MECSHVMAPASEHGVVGAAFEAELTQMRAGDGHST